MCIIFYTLELKNYSIILAANRDEFLSRLTSSLSWHNFNSATTTTTSTTTTTTSINDNNTTLSGLDLEGGGTWLGISILPPPPPLSTSTSTSSITPPTTTTTTPYTLLRFSTLTNFTETLSTNNNSIKPPPSRGFLVKDFLTTSSTNSTNSRTNSNYLNNYLKELELKKFNYTGFNLLLGELLSNGEFKMGYSTNREELNEKEKKKSKILDSSTSSSTSTANSTTSTSSNEEVSSCCSKEKVIGLSNSTVRLIKGKGWPKVESGIKGFEKVIESFSSSSSSNQSNQSNEEDSKEEKDLIEGLWNVLSTAHPTPITERSHLRHTVLVKPLFFDPKATLPSIIPPLPTSSSSTSSSPTSSLPSTAIDSIAKEEGNNNKFWYGTRVQTILIIKKVIVDVEEDGIGKERFKVIMREREAYVLDKETGKPKWSGQEKVFEFLI